jgi:hypothetical protein
MGFLSNIKNNMPIGKRRSSPPPMGLYRKPKLGVPAERTIEGIPISQLPFNPRMPGKPFPRRPKSKKRGGFGGSLREAIRRLKEQQRMMPQPIPERMPTDPSSYYNPTIFGQPIGDMDFSQMPKISPEDMMNLQVPTQMPMTQDLPEVAPVGMMPQMRMGGMQDMEPRMMMAGGDEADSDDFPDLTGDGKVTQADILKGRGVYAEGDEVKSFADYQPEGSLKGTFFDYIPDGYQVSSFLMDKFGQEAAQDPTIREMFEKEFKAARMAGKDVFEFMGKPYNTKTLEEVEGMRYGGEMERFQEGGEIDAMLSGMDSEESGAMEEIEQMAPEMEMIDQLVTMVVQMIQQGASEEEVMMFLREQGLDDEDIGTVLQLVAEMAEAEAMPQDGIGAELEQLA